MSVINGFAAGLVYVSLMDHIEAIVRIEVPYDAFHRIASGAQFKFKSPRITDGEYELTWEENLSRYYDQGLQCIIQPSQYSTSMEINFLIPKGWTPLGDNPWWTKAKEKVKDSLVYRMAAPGEKPTWNDFANMLSYFNYDIRTLKTDPETGLPFEVEISRRKEK